MATTQRGQPVLLAELVLCIAVTTVQVHPARRREMLAPSRFSVSASRTLLALLNPNSTLVLN